jgi:hypothetical protein
MDRKLPQTHPINGRKMARKKIGFFGGDFEQKNGKNRKQKKKNHRFLIANIVTMHHQK